MTDKLDKTEMGKIKQLKRLAKTAEPGSMLHVTRGELRLLFKRIHYLEQLNANLIELIEKEGWHWVGTDEERCP